MEAAQILSVAVQILSGAFAAFIAVCVLFQVYRNVFARTRTVKARVTDKFTTSCQKVSSRGPARTITEYIVVFDCNGITKHFSVSFWFYDAVKIGETGNLKYKGNRMIGFE